MIEKLPFSNGTYYNIKNGNKDELTTKQLEKLKNVFPNANFSLLRGTKGTMTSKDSHHNYIYQNEFVNQEELTLMAYTFIENYDKIKKICNHRKFY
ncbi:hypothetical protein [Winogradskyella sp. UBA3174]|uniref:hypothetical protein n=1 Tax=Winogradskyella sp. UBA3174 TaxID=1947785 RepID=UPI0025E3537E|nr:hypothetical protein [Winogradskyella sp. UBA3174]